MPSTRGTSTSPSSTFSSSPKRRRPSQNVGHLSLTFSVVALSAICHRHTQPELFVECLPLMGGRYNTTTDNIPTKEDVSMIQGILGLSLDLQDMRMTDSVQEKKELYMNGRNDNRTYPMRNADFWAPLTLSTLSLYLTAEMRDDPLFNIYKHGFDRMVPVNYSDRDDDYNLSLPGNVVPAMADRDDFSELNFTEDEVGYFGGYPVEEYAHTLVMNALHELEQTPSSRDGSRSNSSWMDVTTTTGGILPVEDIILVTMVWMAVAHELHEVLRLCGDEYDASKSLAALDRAASLWSGFTNSSGRMLYQLAQEAGSSFWRLGADSDEIEKSWVNNELLDVWNGIQRNLLESPGNCSKNDPVISALREDIYNSINQMTIPLIQNLILSILGTKSSPTLSALDSFDIYYTVVIPHVTACDPNLARELYLPYSIATMNETVKKAWVNTLEKAYSCFRLSCRDIGTFRDDIQNCQNNDNQSMSVTQLTFAGYGATAPVASAFSRIDRDILQLSIFLRSGSMASAKEWYSYGYNSVHSLQTLALGHAIPVVGTFTSSQYELFQEYYSSLTFADTDITTALNFDGRFQSASQETIEAVVLGLLQFEVMYLSVASALQYAVEKCQSQETASAMEYWDVGAAFYVGSMEGRDRGGQSGGQLLYSVSKQLCASFGTCDSSLGSGTNSITNDKIILGLNNGKIALSMNKCQEVHSLLADTIFPTLKTPLIQGTLFYGSRLYNRNVNSTFVESDDVDIDIGLSHAASRSILPAVHEASEQCATTVDRLLMFQANRAFDNEDDILMIFDSFRTVLPAMGVNCIDVGRLRTVRQELCSPVGAQEDVNSWSYTKGYADIALDIAEMKDALLAGNSSVAEEIYKNGKHSFRANPRDSSSLISLRSLSINATARMLDEPLFNKFLYSNTGNWDRATARVYADTYVSATFQSTTDSSKTLPAEAAVLLNVWMYITHLLFETLTDCKSSDFDGKEKVRSLDVASAYWLGDAEIDSPSKSSNLLYGIAKDVGSHFSISDESHPQAKDEFLTLVDRAKEIVLDEGPTCSIAGYMKLREKVHEILHQMTIPLFQGLIHNLLTNDRDRVNLYATSVVPLIVVCNPEDYEFLKTKLLEKSYNAVETDEIVDVLYRSMDCLGMRCDEIGIHFTQDTSPKNNSSRCQSVFSSVAHAGLLRADSFFKYSRLDLDLREMDVLMRMAAFEAAEDIYRYGRYANTSIALLAQSSSLSQIPHFTAYARYFDSAMYADNLVSNALEGIGEGDSSLTNLQRRVLSLRFSQTLVLRQGALDIIFNSILDCNRGQNLSAPMDARSSGKKEVSLYAWDEAAGILVGSILRNGTALLSDHNNWYTPFDLAQQECIIFGVCIEGEIAPINQRMIELLYAGRAASSMGSCAGLRKIGNELESLLLVPIVQATLSAAMKVFMTTSSMLDKAELYAYSEAILPIIADINNEMAISLKSLIEVDATKADPSVFRGIFGVIAQFFEKLDLDCDFIGSLGGMHACDTPTTNYDDTGDSSSGWTIFGIVFPCMMVAVGAIFLFVWWRRSKKGGKLLVGISMSLPEAPSANKTESQDPDDASASQYSYNTDEEDEPISKQLLDELGGTLPMTAETMGVSKSQLAWYGQQTPPSHSPKSNDHILQSFTRGSSAMSVEASKSISRIDRYGDDIPFVVDIDGYQSQA